ncbi:hypothetical protein MIZ03_2390 [Rhodoferax lithotrophicus]|uniref:N-acetyltransferase domain-containing protein n=1 Tax=Rhodoferax lithotrophicus TaxID=2798804 RepID=A0ABM7MML5_9BURK|nr:GNAT family N-acetyltransferase [Rhodoferax sp. MIZ03]BCO27502.1 hypothetical protein MIZ03_2390 [Rhodoferax sp. MIZ03]
MTEFRIATTKDDAVLRQLLRENGMPSWVEMSMEREPSYFAAHHMYGHDWAVLALENGRPFGMYSAAAVPLHVNGKAISAGYLGGLRVHSSERQRIRHLRNGYASIRELAPVLPELPWWFTVIAEENTRARRVLEAGLKGMPRYQPLGDLTTYAISTARARHHGLWRPAQVDDVAAMLAFHARHAPHAQLTPVLSASLVERIGLHCFWLHCEGTKIVAMAALWDQRLFKQVVAQSYHRYLRWGLPLYNRFAHLTHRVVLPLPGQALAQSFIAFFAMQPSVQERLDFVRNLLSDLLSHCQTPVAALGLRSGHPLIPVVSSFKPLSYCAKVYAVEFDSAAQLDGRPVQPEVALL